MKLDLNYRRWFILARYLANSNTKEIHDTINAVDSCNIEKIDKEHRINLDSLSQVMELMHEAGYNGCSKCLGDFTHDHRKDCHSF